MSSEVGLSVLTALDQVREIGNDQVNKNTVRTKLEIWKLGAFRLSRGLQLLIFTEKCFWTSHRFTIGTYRKLQIHTNRITFVHYELYSIKYAFIIHQEPNLNVHDQTLNCFYRYFITLLLRVIICYQPFFSCKTLGKRTNENLMAEGHLPHSASGGRCQHLQCNDVHLHAFLFAPYNDECGQQLLKHVIMWTTYLNFYVKRHPSTRIFTSLSKRTKYKKNLLVFRFQLDMRYE